MTNCHRRQLPRQQVARLLRRLPLYGPAGARPIDGFSLPAFADSASQEYLREQTPEVRRRRRAHASVEAAHGQPGGRDRPRQLSADAGQRPQLSRDQRPRRLPHAHGCSSPRLTARSTTSTRRFPFSTFSSHSRNYTASASWAPQRLVLDRRQLHEAAPRYVRRHRLLRCDRQPRHSLQSAHFATTAATSTPRIWARASI